MAQQILSTNTFLASTWIVNSNATKGTHTTLAGAMTSASSGDTILLETSVTENVTLTPGVNITGYAGAGIGTPNVSITGTLTMTGAGNVTISNVQLITNSANFLVVSGSANSFVNLFNSYLNSLNNTGINFTSSGATSQINIYYCQGNIGTTGITCFTSSAAGNIVFYGTEIDNTGQSTTNSTISSGLISIQFSKLIFPITTSSTAVIQVNNSLLIAQPPTNMTILTHGGSNSNCSVFNSQLASGSSSCVSIGSTLTMGNCIVNSTNTNAISGAGTLINAGISFVNTSYKINTTTQTVAQLDVGGISFDGGTNLLSAYSTGTWTPAFARTSLSTTYTEQVGLYEKIGTHVMVSGYCQVNAVSNAGSGNLTMTGLPFTSNATTAYLSALAMGRTNITYPATTTTVTLEVGTNTTSVAIYANVSTTGATSQAIVLSNSTGYSFGGIYST